MTETDTETIEEQNQRYENFTFEWLPFEIPHPVNAQKAHCLQLGAHIGLGLGALAASTLRVGAVALSSLLYLYVLYRIMDFLEPGEEPTTIAMLQIREKPHYFSSALVACWLVGYLITSVLL